MSVNTLTRRRFVYGTAATGAVLSTGVASASEPIDDVWENQPEHIQTYYDDKLDEIEKYQPRLSTTHLTIKPERVYARYYATPEERTDCIVYIIYYPTQHGFSGKDSHYHDREVVHVFVDDSGDVDSIHYSGYHYLVARDSRPVMDGDRPVLYVIGPHNHMRKPRDGDEKETAIEHGETPPLHDLNERANIWFRNNWEMSPEMMRDPWLSHNRRSWWRKSTTAFGMVDWNPRELEVRVSLTLINANPWSDLVIDV